MTNWNASITRCKVYPEAQTDAQSLWWRQVNRPLHRRLPLSQQVTHSLTHQLPVRRTRRERASYRDNREGWKRRRWNVQSSWRCGQSTAGERERACEILAVILWERNFGAKNHSTFVNRVKYLQTHVRRPKRERERERETVFSSLRIFVVIALLSGCKRFSMRLSFTFLKLTQIH